MHSLEDRFTEFIETIRGQSEHSRRNYRQRLQKFLSEHGSKPAANISPADINAWQRELRSRHLAPATIAGYSQAIKSFFNYCVDVGDVSRSPAAHLKIGSFVSSRIDLVPTESSVLEVTDLANQWVQSQNAQRIRDGLIWLLSVHCGPRLGEIRELLAEDVRRSLQTGPDVHGVYRVPTMGKVGRVQIRFAEHIADAFHSWLDVRPECRAPECFVTIRPLRVSAGADPVFRPLTRSAATRIYENICAAAGVSPPIRSHALRHRLGHLTTQQYGAKVAAIVLNHRDWQRPTTALAFYHHPDESDASRAILSHANTHVEAAREVEEMRRLFGLEPH